MTSKPTTLDPDFSLRLVVCGDTHGDATTVRGAVAAASAAGSPYMVQVGDFGYWEHTPAGQMFLDTCNAIAKDFKTPIVFLDGNHENHPLLWDVYAEAEKSPEGFWQIRPGVFYAPRGHRWTWGEKTFLAVGGAYSIDRDWRVLGDSYWLTEEITEEDVETASAGGKVDVMFSHDAPLSVSPLPPGARIFPETEPSRKRLERIVEATRPDILVHGHFHRRYNEQFVHRDGFVTNVEGLAADGDPGTVILLEV